MTPPHATPDAATWARLSPLLDEALDLPPADRAAWLAALQQRAPQDAVLLQGLLERHEAAGRDDFLAGSAHALSQVPAAGHRVGPWTIEAPLGEGGMASVWLARRSDGRHQGQAAIKLLHGRLHGTQASQRFEREGRILARLEHPHIARLLDAGVAEDAQPYLVLELVRGQAIDRWCDERQLDIEARLRLFVDVVQAVAAAHAQLVVHRDLKPGNVMVDGQGQVKLLDFGIARLLDEGEDGAAQATTLTGQRAFTPAWAAPEQVRGEPVSTATDVWALGVLLCHLLTGRHWSGLPWSSDLTAWMRAAALPKPKRPSRLAAMVEEGGEDATALAAARGLQPLRLVRRLQGELDQIVLRALAEEPGRRYTSAQALADDVLRHLRNEPVSAVADTVGYRAAKFVRRNRLMVGAASTTLLALMAGVVGTSWQAVEAQRQRVQAEAQLQVARAQRAEARYQARASSASSEFMSALLSEVGPGGQPLKPEQLLERGRELAEKNHAGNPALLSELLIALSVRYEILGRRDSELALRQLAEAAARRAADANALANTLCAAVQADIEAGRAEAAQARVLEARRVLAAAAASATPPRLQVEHVCLNADADLAAARGDSAAALRFSQQGVALFEAADEREDKAYIVALNNLAYHHHAAGQTAQAFEIMLKLGAVMDRTGRRGTRDRLTAMINEGALRITFGEMQQAEAVLRDAVQRAQGPDLSRPAVDMGLARAYGVALHHMRRDDDALIWLQHAAARSREERNARIEVESLLHMASTQLYAGRPAAAHTTLAAASAALPSGATNAGDLVLAIDRVRAQLALQQGDVAKAQALMQAQLKQLGYASAKPRAGLLTTLPIAARAALAAGEIAEARTLADAALQRATTAARLPEQSSRVGRAWWLLGDVQQRQGQQVEATASWRRALPILVAALGPQHPQTLELQAMLFARP